MLGRIEIAEAIDDEGKIARAPGRGRKRASREGSDEYRFGGQAVSWRASVKA